MRVRRQVPEGADVVLFQGVAGQEGVSWGGGGMVMLGWGSRPVGAGGMSWAMRSESGSAWSQITEHLVCHVKKSGSHGGYPC